MTAEVFGLDQLTRFAEPSHEELCQMLRDGKGRPAVVRYLADQEMKRRNKVDADKGAGGKGPW